MQLFNCAIWSFFPKHDFRWWAKLTTIMRVISVHLEQQDWFQVCVLPMVPITFRSIIPLTWCRRWLITSSWNSSTNVSWSSSTLWALPGYQLSSWWEILSLTPMICVSFDHFIAFRTTQTCSCFVLYLEFHAIQLMLWSTAEYYHLLCWECRGNFTTSWEFLI